MQLSDYQDRQTCGISKQMQKIEDELFLLSAKPGEADFDKHLRIRTPAWRTYPPGEPTGCSTEPGRRYPGTYLKSAHRGSMRRNLRKQASM